MSTMKALRTLSFKPLCGIIFCVTVIVVAFGTSCSNSGDTTKDKFQKESMAQIGLYETYSWDEVADAFINLSKEAAKQNTNQDALTLERLLNQRSESPVWSNPNYSSDKPVIGWALVEDTAAVNSIIAQYGAEYLPQDLKLAWSFKPFEIRHSTVEQPESYELIALKTSDGKPSLTGESIASVQKDITPDNQYCMLFKFDDEGARQFAQMTARNVNRYIANVIKGKVYSYPMVMCEISNGNAQIAGNFTEEDIDSIISFIYGKK